MILVIDNYDSFTHNLVQAIEALGETTTVVFQPPAPAGRSRDPQ